MSLQLPRHPHLSESPIRDLRRAHRLTVIDTSIRRRLVLRGYPPERVLDNNRGVVPAPSSRNRIRPFPRFLKNVSKNQVIQ